MNKQLTFYILLICLTGSLITCKSGKVSASDSQLTSKEVESVKFSSEVGNKEEQALPADTTKNLKSLKDEKVYKNFVDSIENGITIEVMFGSYLQKADSVPQILKETFPNVYFLESEHDSGHGIYISYVAYYKGILYGSGTYNRLIMATCGFSNLSRETQIRAFNTFYFHDSRYKTRNVVVNKRKINDVECDFSVNMSTPYGSLELAFAFCSDGAFFQIMDVTDNKNVLFTRFEYATQY